MNKDEIAEMLEVSIENIAEDLKISMKAEFDKANAKLEQLYGIIGEVVDVLVLTGKG